ncbi:MAG: ATP-binding protein [Catalinimonas sp.]
MRDHETFRLDKLHSYHILDTLNEQEFDDLVALASRICEAPISLISLVDAQRQWFKARVGLEVTSTDRELAFCNYTIRQKELLEVPDATLDDRFKQNPLVTGEPSIRFYAGEPLITPDGHALGSLCVIDHVPRRLNDLQRFALRVLSRQVVDLMEMRRKSRWQDLTLRRAERTARQGTYEIDVRAGNWTCSEPFCDLLGVSVVGSYPLATFWELMHADDVAEQRHCFETKLDEQDRFDCEFRCVARTTGRTFYVRNVCEVIRDDDGRPERVVGIMQDISDKKSDRARLEQRNAELRRANEEMDNFVYRVSHDLRAPITTLAGLFNLIKGEDDPAQRHAYVLMAERCIEKQDTFIREIIDYAQNARQVVRAEPLDLAQILEEVVTEFSHYAQRQGVVVRLRVDQSGPFVGDRQRLTVLVNNLLSNGLRFADRGRKQPSVQLEAHVAPDALRLSVTDNGVGIAPEHVPNVFGMFYRATDHGTGAGLGLYITRQIAEKVGGRIELTSTRGVGTEVNVTWPNVLEDAPTARAEVPRSPAADAAQEHAASSPAVPRIPAA